MDIAKELAEVYIKRWMEVPMGGRDLEKELWRLKVMDNLDRLPDDMKEYMEGIPNDRIYYSKLPKRIDDEFNKTYQNSNKTFPKISDEEMETDLPKYLEGILREHKNLGQIGAGVIVVNDRYLIRFSQNF